jgi:hypothetical protein
VAVSTLTKDVDIREYSNWREYLIAFVACLVLFAVVFGPMMILEEWWTFRRKIRQLTRLSEALEKSASLELTSEQHQLVVDMCDKELEIRPTYFYRKMLSILGRE